MTIEKKMNETDEEYLIRLCSCKAELDLSWSDIADYMQEVTGVKKDESVYRKWWTSFSAGMKYQQNVNPDERMAELQGKELFIKKELVKLSDTRSELLRDIRAKARQESLSEQIKNFVIDNNLVLRARSEVSKQSNVSAILVFSDAHYGLYTNHAFNKYSPEIFIDRMSKLRDETIRYIKANGVSTLHFLNLNDSISGIIHTTTRLDNRKNVIEQVMGVTELISQFLDEVSRYCNVEYYSCIDNHSRCMANKSENIADENYSLLIDWYLKEKFKNVASVHFNDNAYGSDIINFSVYGWNYLAVHGDKDKVNNVTQNMTLMTHKFYDAIFTAHYHHIEAKEVGDTMVFSNGSICGVDNYAKDLRCSGKPSQTLYIVTPEHPYESVNIIRL